MLLYGVSFADELQPGDVLITSPLLGGDSGFAVSFTPEQVKRVDKHEGEPVQVEVQNGKILLLRPSQSVIIGRVPDFRDVT